MNRDDFGLVGRFRENWGNLEGDLFDLPVVLLEEDLQGILGQLRSKQWTPLMTPDDVIYSVPILFEVAKLTLLFVG